MDVEVDFLTAQNLGSEVIFDYKNKKLLYSVRQGKDRRIDQDVNDPVLLSTDMDTILSSEYTYDKSEMKNFAYVAGAGEGAARKVISVSDSPFRGWTDMNCMLTLETYRIPKLMTQELKPRYLMKSTTQCSEHAD